MAKSWWNFTCCTHSIGVTLSKIAKVLVIGIGKAHQYFRSTYYAE
jgi:hypothetical protein